MGKGKKVNVENRSYSFRLYPNKDQERELLSQLETLRRVYNGTLEFWKGYYEQNKKNPSKSELYQLWSAPRNEALAALKRGEVGPHWLAKVSAVAVRDTAFRVVLAYKHFFRRLNEGKRGKAAGEPKFKRYGRNTSIPFNNYNSGCVLKTKKGEKLLVDVPLQRSGYKLEIFGVGKVKILAHRDIQGVIKTVCVKRYPTCKWYATFVTEFPSEPVPERGGEAVGIDVGITKFVATSKRTYFDNPRLLQGKLKLLRKLQRSCSRKAEGAKKRKQKQYLCKNLQKSYRKVTAVHSLIKDLRKEFHTRTSRSLVARYGAIAYEGLNVQGMVKNKRLARLISDAGWSAFLSTLRFQAYKAGVKTVEVDPKYTSQTCFKCGHCSKDNRTTQADFDCVNCGHSEWADVNAAQNIRRRGFPEQPLGSGGS